MSQQLGRLLLVKIGDGASPETFNHLCGLKSRSWDLSPNEVDTTIPDCENPGGPVQKTADPGIVNRVFSGSGNFVSGATQSLLVQHIINGTKFNAQVLVPGLGEFEGQFMASTTFQGDMEGSMTFDITLTAAAVLEFTAAA